MDLITSAEIAYFRSIYKENLSDLTGANVLFGRNDSGKSNVLRALNLFFNNQTTPGQPFRFDRDFCHARQAQAEDAQDVRKFVYVKLWFGTPPNWRPSLGSEFWVKKQWSITRESDPIFDSSIRDPRRQQYLTRFLNKIAFHYIPAIKDRRIFERLLGQIYEVIASQEAFSTSLSDFSEALRARTEDLTSEILDGVGVNSVIAPPEDLTGLFHSLDFETNTEAGDAYSLTHQRGDGVQVRHIPAILAFLSDRGQREYHLWGFEEPENSLELANAIGEADSFCRYGQHSNKQIFLTSHSPAFFSLGDHQARRFFVSKLHTHGTRSTSTIKSIQSGEDDPSELMGETPHLPVISKYLAEAHSKIEQLREQGEELDRLLEQRDQSLLFVEGNSDAIVLNAAWSTFVGGALPFDIEDATGTTKMESLAKDGRVLNQIAPGRSILALVDNDNAGREVYRNKRLQPGGAWVRHNSNGVYWCRLPFERNFEQAMQTTGIPQSHWPGCLENLFPPTYRSEAEREGAYGLTETPHEEFLDPQYFPRIQHWLRNDRIERYYVLAPTHDYKIEFAQWVAARARREPEILEPLRPVIEGLRQVLEQQRA